MFGIMSVRFFSFHARAVAEVTNTGAMLVKGGRAK